jgi:hypothetical protein
VAKHDEPVLITGVGKMWVEDGLLLVPAQSWRRNLLFVMAPGVGLSAAHSALRVLSANIMEMATERAAGH